MGLHIYHHVIFDQSESEINQYNIITTKLNQIMGLSEDLTAKVAELSTKVDTLQTAVDTEQEQIAALLATNAAVVTELNTQISNLQSIIDGSVGGEVAATVLTSVQESIAKLEAAQADLEATA